LWAVFFPYLSCHDSLLIFEGLDHSIKSLQNSTFD
jgi:hypothetical protein